MNWTELGITVWLQLFTWAASQEVSRYYQSIWKGCRGSHVPHSAKNSPSDRERATPFCFCFIFQLHDLRLGLGTGSPLGDQELHSYLVRASQSRKEVEVHLSGHSRQAGILVKMPKTRLSIYQGPGLPLDWWNWLPSEPAAWLSLSHVIGVWFTEPIST